MKKLLMIPVLFFLFSCETEGELTKSDLNPITITPPDTTTPAPENAVLKYSGVFSPTSGISVSGGLKIYLDNNEYKLMLEGFTISSGPDLKIYLSKSASPDDFVTLGNLTSARVYVVPQSVSVASYSHVLIHCQQYNHLFAIAELTQN